ncbi:MAG: tetratricopeptide repeat protein [Proteobacteria bacterium]|nr:tetratricopeptide repeat protein [Pseudomonadota bacterium]
MKTMIYFLNEPKDELEEVTCDLLIQGQEYLKKGEFSKAFESFSTATEVNPDFAPAWNMSGHCYRLGYGVKVLNPRQAFECYKKATEVDANNSLSWFYLGTCYKEGFGVSKQPDLANQCYLKAKAIDPDFIMPSTEQKQEIPRIHAYDPQFSNRLNSENRAGILAAMPTHFNLHELSYSAFDASPVALPAKTLTWQAAVRPQSEISSTHHDEHNKTFGKKA